MTRKKRIQRKQPRTTNGYHLELSVLVTNLYAKTAPEEKMQIDMYLGAKTTLQGGFCFENKNYLLKLGLVVSLLAKALGPGSDIEKYIFAAFVVPKSLLEPLFCTLLKASRNI